MNKLLTAFSIAARPLAHLGFLKPLLASRKFQSAVTGSVVALVARRGFHVDPEIVGMIVALFVAHIAGTAYEDGSAKRAPTQQVAVDASQTVNK
ncbi:MAG: hypothetical protein ACJ741_06570 [Pyrinomonadaceae bacterium]